MTYNAEKIFHRYISGKKISNSREVWEKNLN